MIIPQPERVLLRRQIASLSRHVSGNVLDVGGGDGRRYRSLFSCDSYASLDVSGLGDIRASADAIPLPDAAVDSVLCFQVLHYFADPLPALREVRRVLRPGGAFLLSFPQFLAVARTTRCSFTALAVRELCEEAGFAVVETLPRGRLPSAIAQTVIRALCGRFRPYETRSMYALAPLSWLLTKAALSLDRFFEDDTFAMGFTMLLR